MRREDLAELHNITHIDNLQSIRQRGILSHARASRIAHHSVAMGEIQEKRAKVRIPNGLLLHQYANLYINARNKMMYKVRRLHRDLCILIVSAEVLDEDGVVIADRNASSDYVIFRPSPGGLALIDRNLVFAQSWVHEDPREQWRRGSAICAEVLVPSCVPAEAISGGYVSCPQSRDRVLEVVPDLEVVVNGDLFFR